MAILRVRADGAPRVTDLRTRYRRPGYEERLQEFEDESIRGISVYRMRNLFLERIEAHAGEVVKSLEEAPLRAYLNLSMCYYRCDYADRPDYHTIAKILHKCHPREWPTLDEWRTMRPGLEPLRDSLLAWGRRWHLGEAWCFDRAVEWLFCNRYPNEWRYKDNLPAVPDNPVSLPFDLHLRGWRPAFESRDRAAERLRAAFEDAMRQHFEAVAAASDSTGRKAPPRQAKVRHLTWLVLFQCKMMSYKEIADDYQVSTKSVEGAVKDVAALIDLTPRRPARGRPRGASGTAYLPGRKRTYRDK